MPLSLSLSLRRTVMTAVVMLLAYGGGVEFTGIIHPDSAQFGAMWAAVSGLAVLQDDLAKSWDAAGVRIWGTLVGAAVAGLSLTVLPFSFWGLALAAGLAAGIGTLVRLTDGGRLSAITVTVIMVLSVINPDLHPLGNALLRFAESLLGSGVALAVAWGLSRLDRWRGRPRPL